MINKKWNDIRQQPLSEINQGQWYMIDFGGRKGSMKMRGDYVFKQVRNWQENNYRRQQLLKIPAEKGPYTVYENTVYFESGDEIKIEEL